MKPYMLSPVTVPPDWRRQLRSLVPDHPLAFAEAQRSAAAQARQLRSWLRRTPRALTVDVLARLPGLTLRCTSLRGSRAPLSSHSSYQRGGWHIHTDAALPTWMRRWVVAHEIKHILDASLVAEQMRLLTLQQRETLCDYFAAALLIPTRSDLKQWRSQGRPCYSADGISDTITSPGPEVSKDDLTPIGDSG